MPVYQLNHEVVFPHPSLAEPDGLLAIGGDLSPLRILTAYVNGIFPWYNQGEPILWWSPDPRCVLFPNKLKVSKSLRLLINRNVFEVRFDSNFKKVITSCRKVHIKKDEGTWISPDMINAYCKLHELGFAHSVETYCNNKLVGGLYGVSIGKVFYGESMFHTEANASKIAMYFLVEKLKELRFELIDNQVTSDHLLSLGAEEIERERFIYLLKEHAQKDISPSKW
jgi:leucyl/phenylalanyl-tRNA--protein transferase